MSADSIPFEDTFQEPPRNGVYKSKAYQGRGTKLVKMNQLFGERRIRSSSPGYDLLELSEKEKLKLLLRKGDLLFSRTSVVANGVGKCSLITETSEELTWDSNIIRIRLNTIKADPEYYFYFFNSPTGRELVLSMSGGAAITTIKGSSLAKGEVPAPDLPTQKRIAGILSAYDDLIENNLKRIRILEEMAQSLYREWFVHFHYPGHESVPLVDSPLGPIPEGWEAKKLGDVLELKYGKALKKADRKGGPIPVYASSGIVGHHDKSSSQGPGLIIGRKGNVGSVFWSSTDFFVIDTAYFVESDLPLRYLYYLMPTLNFINSDAAVPGLSRNQAYSLDVAVPPQALINRFCTIAETFEAQVESLSKRNQTLRQTRDLLLPKLLTPPE
jgi:type I restriction enzyme S subunit